MTNLSDLETLFVGQTRVIKGKYFYFRPDFVLEINENGREVLSKYTFEHHPVKDEYYIRISPPIDDIWNKIKVQVILTDMDNDESEPIHVG